MSFFYAQQKTTAQSQQVARVEQHSDAQAAYYIRQSDGTYAAADSEGRILEDLQGRRDTLFGPESMSAERHAATVQNIREHLGSQSESHQAPDAAETARIREYLTQKYGSGVTGDRGGHL